jgi:hypothetical protein
MLGFQLVSETVESLDTTRPQDEAHSACRKTTRARLADARAGAGDQDELVFEPIHLNVRQRP